MDPLMPQSKTIIHPQQHDFMSKYRVRLRRLYIIITEEVPTEVQAGVITFAQFRITAL